MRCNTAHIYILEQFHLCITVLGGNKGTEVFVLFAWRYMLLAQVTVFKLYYLSKRDIAEGDFSPLGNWF